MIVEKEKKELENASLCEGEPDQSKLRVQFQLFSRFGDKVSGWVG